MECISFTDFTELSKPKEEYYAGRWAYFSEVIRMVNEIQPDSVLELGPALFTVFKNSDIMHKPKPHGRWRIAFASFELNMLAVP